MEVSTSRINQINKLLLYYSAGKYQKKAKISPYCDDFDSILAGLNMLGEELANTTVSRDFFSSIYNATTDMLFVVSPAGYIKTANEPACSILGYTEKDLRAATIELLLGHEEIPGFLTRMKNHLDNHQTYSAEMFFFSSNGKKIPVEFSCSKIESRKNVAANYLIVANDITERKLAEQRILRTMVETQQLEQGRIARDLHDMFGPTLSDIQRQFSRLLLDESDPYRREIINEGLNKLGHAVKEIRSICSNIMPSSLERYGLKDSLNQLKKNWQHWGVNIDLQCEDGIAELEKSVAVAAYFIILEFINNTIKYAGAKNIFIHLFFRNNSFILDIFDDGKGFILEEKLHSGRGLSNMATRIRAFDGSYKIITGPGEGTRLIADFPNMLCSV